MQNNNYNPEKLNGTPDIIGEFRGKNRLAVTYLADFMARSDLRTPEADRVKAQLAAEAEAQPMNVVDLEAYRQNKPTETIFGTPSDTVEQLLTEIYGIHDKFPDQGAASVKEVA